MQFVAFDHRFQIRVHVRIGRKFRDRSAAQRFLPVSGQEKVDKQFRRIGIVGPYTLLRVFVRAANNPE
jgi:hypothetical protein